MEYFLIMLGIFVLLIFLSDVGETAVEESIASSEKSKSNSLFGDESNSLFGDDIALDPAYEDIPGNIWNDD